MKIYNASIFPTPDADAALIPMVLCTDRGFWQASIDPALGKALPDAGVVPEIDAARLKAVCQDAIARCNSTLVFDIESASLAQASAPAELFADRLAQYCRLADLAHSYGVQRVSAFGLPFHQTADRNYSSTLNQWQANGAALKPLLDKLDFLAPCFYSAGMELASWCSLAAWTAGVCRSLCPGKPLIPFLSARAGFANTDGRYEDPMLFYRRLVFARSLPVDAVCYWDANFNTQYKTLDQLPIYAMLRTAALYDPIWPPDGPAYGVPIPAPSAVPATGTAGA